MRLIKLQNLLQSALWLVYCGLHIAALEDASVANSLRYLNAACWIPQDYRSIIQIGHDKCMICGACTLLSAGCENHSSSSLLLSEVNTTDISLEFVSCTLISNVTIGTHLQTFYCYKYFDDSCMAPTYETPTCRF
jgi:hypothetical protein